MKKKKQIQLKHTTTATDDESKIIVKKNAYRKKNGTEKYKLKKNKKNGLILNPKQKQKQKPKQKTKETLLTIVRCRYKHLYKS